MKNKWFINIEKVSNGFIVKGNSEDDDNDSIIETYLIEDKDIFEKNNELKSLQELCYVILSHFGYYASKHDKKILDVVIRDNDE